eukprot:Seg1057.7 transcript_id=Seg1057.7/GoldUCD/mRNA.D3Y31 product="hypothetical protein" protein_id=Seg1057.7/GoldUCD/D3Y31
MDMTFFSLDLQEPVYLVTNLLNVSRKAFIQHNGGLKFTTTTMRKALVNWVIETEKDDEVRQAVACLMSHSTRVQRLRYDTLLSAPKMRKAAEHLTGKMKESFGLKRSLLDGESYLPFRDQVTAIVAQNSMYNQPADTAGKSAWIQYGAQDGILSRACQCRRARQLSNEHWLSLGRGS